jgi:hypothetical protein
MTAIASKAGWIDAAEKLKIRSQAFIGGKFVAARSGETFSALNPANGKIVANVAACEGADIDAAVLSARAAFESGSWSRLAPAGRKKKLQLLAELILKHADELALLAHGWRSELCQKATSRRAHSITSSARARSDPSTSIPSAFAVFRLMVSLNSVG